MDDFFVRRYKSADYEGVLKVWEPTGLGNAFRGDNAVTIEKTIRMEGCFFVLVKKESKEIIGTSWISNDGRRLYLHHFGILPEYQGKGLSKPLLKKSLEFAREKNMQIKLEVHQDNEIALDLYKKHGFSYLGDYHVYIIRNIQEINLSF